MPGVTVHLRLAELVLEHWRSHRADSPFDPLDRCNVNAFRVGAMGPDMGYFPGGFRPISDLAHTVSPGSLARTLLASATCPRQRAFSWGWVTHVLADIRAHPLVGRAVGELLHGSSRHFVAADDDAVSHVRVEAGVDAVYARAHPALRHRPLVPFLDPSSVAFIRDAYLHTYGAAPPLRRFLDAHRLAPRRMRQGLSLAWLAGGALPAGPADPPPSPGALARIRDFVGGRSVPLAFLLPAAPRPWLLKAVREVEDGFTALVLEAVRTGGRSIPEANLDTGRHYLTHTDHGGMRRALAYLAAAAGAAASLPAARDAA